MLKDPVIKLNLTVNYDLYTVNIKTLSEQTLKWYYSPTDVFSYI